MNCLRRFINGLLCIVIISSFATLCTAQGAEAKWRFDCGTADSPVMPGYQRLTGDDTYSESSGYGWEGTAPQGVLYALPALAGSAGGRSMGEGYFQSDATDLTRDGVVSESDLLFRADVPNGTYRVTLTIGDLSRAIGSIDVRMNGELTTERAAAWRPGSYRMVMKTPAGWWAYVRHTVEVKDGAVRVSLQKNQTYYDEHMAEQSKWDSPYLAWRPGPLGYPNEPPYNYIGWPFLHNSVMGIEIVPHVPAPVVAEDDKLKLARPLRSEALNDAIAKFNEKDFAGSLRAVKGVREPEAQAARAAVGLWLAGRLEIEEEEKLVPAALALLREYAAAHPDENGAAELVQDAAIFEEALTIHLTRGELGKNHFIENDKAIGWWWLINDDSPLHYKTQLYIARATHMLMPYIPVLGMERQILDRLEKKFPDNRYVKYYLHQEWERYGDGSKPTDWVLEDYYAKSEGAPEWARSLQAAWASQVDWAEWWIRFKQQPEGSIGGGLSDDVEMVGGLAYVAFVSRGVSDTTIAGARKLCEANWRYGGIDDDVGYSLPTADAEHTAEPTGDTLGMMMKIDYGNPLWIERSFKTGKLMRDFWTAPNVHGLRHFRANFMGAGQMGGGYQANDSWINLRAAQPAFAVLEYNQNPAISKVVAELADGWVRDAMSTERGKPRGIIPADVSFPDALIGGTASENWYTASHPGGTVNYDWAGRQGQRYKNYMQQLLIAAHKQTGDVKYVEPLRLEYELAAKYGYVPELQVATRLSRASWIRPSEDTRDGLKVILERWQPKYITAEKKAESGKPEAAAEESPEEEAAPEEGSDKWAAKELKGVETWLSVKRMMEGRKGKLENDITREQIIDHASYAHEMMKMRWPLMTTLASATDRVGFAGFPNPLIIYTGGLASMAVTYDDTTKYFAAALMASDAQGFRLLYCNMTPETREVGIVPWELEPSGRYVLKYGPDADENDLMDSVAEEREFVFAQAGTPIRITVEPLVTYIVEVDQSQRGRVAGLAPDPGLSAEDIRYEEMRVGGVILAKIHNVGSKRVKNVEVVFYDGDPDDGGKELGRNLVPNIEAPNDLEPRATTVGIGWAPTKEAHDIYVVVDPNGEIEDEITTFNNVAHAALPE